MSLLKYIIKESYDYSYSSGCGYRYAYDCTAPTDYEELEFIVDNLEEEIEWDELVEVVGIDEIKTTGLLDIYEDTPLNIEDDYAVSFYKLKKYWDREDDGDGELVDVYVIEHSAIEHVFKKEE